MLLLRWEKCFLHLILIDLFATITTTILYLVICDITQVSGTSVEESVSNVLLQTDKFEFQILENPRS